VNLPKGATALIGFQPAPAGGSPQFHYYVDPTSLPTDVDIIAAKAGHDRAGKYPTFDEVALASTVEIMSSSPSPSPSELKGLDWVLYKTTNGKYCWSRSENVQVDPSTSASVKVLRDKTLPGDYFVLTSRDVKPNC
jgi:hypothetical protein